MFYQVLCFTAYPSSVRMTCSGSARQPAAVARRPAARGGAATGRGRPRHGNPQRWAEQRPAAGASGYRQRGRRPAAEAVRSRAAGGGAATGSRRRHGDLQQGCQGGDLQRQRASPCSGGTRICSGRDLQPQPRIDLQRQQPPAMTAHQSAAPAAPQAAAAATSNGGRAWISGAQFFLSVLGKK